jgi:hypothetical protein
VGRMREAGPRLLKSGVWFRIQHEYRDPFPDQGPAGHRVARRAHISSIILRPDDRLGQALLQLSSRRPHRGEGAARCDAAAGGFVIPFRHPRWSMHPGANTAARPVSGGRSGPGDQSRNGSRARGRAQR